MANGWQWPRSLLHTFLRVPRSLQLAHVDNLPDMVSIMSADVRNGWCPHRQLLLVGRVHKFLQVRHHLVKLPHRVTPLLVIKFHEGLFVVAAEFLRRLSFELE